MIRLAFFGIVIVVAFLIWAVKAAAGTVTDNEDLKKTTFKGQTQRTMDKSARGLNWLEKQWDSAKTDAEQGKGEASKQFKDYDR